MLQLFLSMVILCASNTASAEIKIQFSDNIHEHWTGKCFQVSSMAKGMIRMRISHLRQVVHEFANLEKIKIQINALITCRSYGISSTNGYIIWKIDFAFIDKKTNQRIVGQRMPYFVFIGSDMFYPAVKKKVTVRKFNNALSADLNEHYRLVDEWIVSYARKQIAIEKAQLRAIHLNIGPLSRIEINPFYSYNYMTYVGGGMNINLNIESIRVGFDFTVGSTIFSSEIPIDMNTYIGFRLTDFARTYPAVFIEVGWSFQRRALRSALLSLEDLNGLIVAFEIKIRALPKQSINIKPYFKVGHYTRGQYFSLTALSVGFAMSYSFQLIN